MVFRKCDDCKMKWAFESDEDVPFRHATAEDCTSPERVIEYCPDCGGYLYEISEEAYEDVE